MFRSPPYDDTLIVLIRIGLVSLDRKMGSGNTAPYIYYSGNNINKTTT